MVLNQDIDQYDAEEREEVLSYLPNYEGKKVLELASGIGRFTGKLAEKAAHVETIDYAPHFLEVNQKAHKAFTNITYKCIDAIDLDYPKKCVRFNFYQLALSLFHRSTTSLFF